jgi:large subunit ribosomal protein L18
MKSQKLLNKKRKARSRRVGATVRGNAHRPRLVVFRSNRGMYAQLINDAEGRTLVSASSRDIKKKAPKAELAAQVGEAIAKKAASAGISAAVFDRRSYRYHGRVKALADGARKGGLKL